MWNSKNDQIKALEARVRELERQTDVFEGPIYKAIRERQLERFDVGEAGWSIFSQKVISVTQALYALADHLGLDFDALADHLGLDFDVQRERERAILVPKAKAKK